MKRFFYLLALWWPVSVALCQNGPLQVGSALPQATLRPLLHYPQDSLPLETCKGKAVLFDFFATTCGACVAALPRLDSLQQQLGPQLQVLVVTSEPAAQVRRFLQRHPALAGLRLPFVTNDSLLCRWFPYKLIPHEVWVNRQGRVAAITHAAAVNAAHLRQLLEGVPLHLPLKKDQLLFDQNKTFMENMYSGDLSGLVAGSVFTRYQPGVFSGEGIVIANGLKRIYFLNYPLLALYQSVLNIPYNRVVLQCSQLQRYQRPEEENEQWNADNLYGYELTLPATASKQTVQARMLNDLNHYLPVEGRMETRRVKCWLLVRAGAPAEPLAKPLNPQVAAQPQQYLLQRQPMAALVKLLNTAASYQPGLPVFLDETGYRGMVNLVLPKAAMHQVPLLREALKPYGLLLVAAARPLEMFVLKEKR